MNKQSKVISLSNLECVDNMETEICNKVLGSMPPLNELLDKYYKSIEPDVNKSTLFGYTLLIIWEKKKRKVSDYPTKEILALNKIGCQWIDSCDYENNNENTTYSENDKSNTAFAFIKFVYNLYFQIVPWLENADSSLTSLSVGEVSLNEYVIHYLFYSYVEHDYVTKRTDGNRINCRSLIKMCSLMLENQDYKSKNKFLLNKQRKEEMVNILLTKHILKIDKKNVVANTFISEKIGPKDSISLDKAGKIGCLFEKHSNDKSISADKIIADSCNEFDLEEEAIKTFIKMYIKYLPDRPATWKDLTEQNMREMWMFRNGISRKIKKN
jgi:hypothetical protein